MFQRIVLLFSICVAIPSQGKSFTEDQRSLSQRLEKMIKQSKIERENLALMVIKLSDGESRTLYTHQASRQMIPASLSKIFTAGAVINELSAGHRFITQLLSSAEIKKGVLKGDLYLKGGGDPSFVSEKLWVLVNRLLRSGVRTIKGDIVVDDSLFDKDFYPGRSDHRVDRAYDAPISAMSFNWNSVNIYLRPGTKINEKVNVVLDPQTDYVELLNTAKTGKKKSYSVKRAVKKNHDQIIVRGRFPLGAEEKVVYKNITRPALWSAHNLKTFLKHRGVELKGSIRKGKVPNSAKLLAEVKSKPLSHVLADLMKFSNNYVAEMLTKYLAVTRGETGNNKKGLSIIRDYVKSLGFSDKDFHLINASGLSRENRFSVEQIVASLNHLHHRFDIAPEFITALPIAGVDGTLKSRMKSTLAENWVRAKTGLLNGVVGLAGYSGRQNGEVLTFAFLYNGSAGSEVQVRELFDRLSVELVR